MGKLPHELKPCAEKLSKYNKEKQRRLRSNEVMRWLLFLLLITAGVGTVYIIVVSLMGRYQELWDTVPYLIALVLLILFLHWSGELYNWISRKWGN